MLRKLLSKRFFSTKLNFVEATSIVKNLVYFGTEGEILTNPAYSKVLRNEVRIKDFKKKKVGFFLFLVHRQLNMFLFRKVDPCVCFR